MSKWTKFKNKPALFFRDMLVNTFQNKKSSLEKLQAPKKKVQTPKKKVQTPKKKVQTPKKKVQTPKKKVQTPKKKVQPTKPKEELLPKWFNVNIYDNDSDDENVFLYMPWIQSHTDTLIEKIVRKNFSIKPFEMILNVSDNEVRRSVLRYARNNSDIYRKLVIKALLPYKNKISGFIFTLDWIPAMRVILDVCRDFEIPTILIPHESVFADQNMYYKDPVSLASLPRADYILSWGNLQKKIFVNRGYDETHIIPIGALKFDNYFGYQPILSRKQFFSIYNLDTNKKTILFASQPLDSQFDTKLARESQRHAIIDLLQLCEENSLQLIVRMPPSKDKILNKKIADLIINSNYAVIDDAHFYLTPPEESIYHCDIITSINSTMLFEGILMGRYALSTKYIEFDQIWEKVGIPAVKNYEELSVMVDSMLKNQWQINQEGLDWASHQFGIGEFDGKASARAGDFLDNLIKKYNGREYSFRPNLSEKMILGERIDIISIPSGARALETIQKYLPQLLNTNTLISSINQPLEALASVEIFCQWGITTKQIKKAQKKIADSLGKPTFIIEDGFLRSIDIGLSEEPTLSIIIDDLTAYYDATRPSRLETILNSNEELNEEQLLFSKHAIERIVTEKVSKYNHARSWDIKIGREGVDKILLVDQRFGDQSVISGLADESTFEQMLYDALTNNPDADIIIKQHPDAIKGGKSSYFSNERIQGLKEIYKNLYIIYIDINPYALLDIIDEVYVVSSGMGMEALLAGKVVHCYGAPYYSGWGLTKDQITISRRNRTRNLEDVFHYAYIKLSRYLNPKTKKIGNIHDVIDYIVENKKG